MSAYDDAVTAIRKAQLAVYHGKEAVKARRHWVARAWDLLPGGKEWDDLAADVNAELPPQAWLTYGTLRHDEAVGRKARRGGADVAGAGGV